MKQTTQRLERRAEILKAVAEPCRLKILLHLQGGERCVTEIMRGSDLSQPNASRHLGTLHATGLINRRRAGNKTYYSIARPEVLEILQQVDSILNRRIRES